MMSVYHLIIKGNILVSPYNITDHPFSSLDFKNLKTFENIKVPAKLEAFFLPFKPTRPPEHQNNKLPYLS